MALMAASPIVETAGLDLDVARPLVAEPGVLEMAWMDLEDVLGFGVRATPTFFVDGRLLDPFGAAELRTLVAGEGVAAGSRPDTASKEKHMTGLEALVARASTS